MLIGLGWGLGSWLILSLAYLLGAFEPIDLRLLDARFKLRGERPAGDRVVLVGVDDETIRGYGAWPLPRDAYALLISALEDAGARAIGVDLQFPNDRNQDAGSNALLAHVSGAHENVVHSIWFYARESGSRSTIAASSIAREALDRHGVVAETSRAAPAAGVALPFEDLAASVRRVGHITVAVDRDGTIRRAPLFVRYGHRLYPSFAMVLSGVEQGYAAVPPIQTTYDGFRLRWPNGRVVSAQVDRFGSTGIDFAGDAGAFPLAYSMIQVLQWYQAGDLPRLRQAFAGKTVMVGLTSREEASEDVGPTPFSAATPLLFVHANMLENLHRGRFLSRPPTFVFLLALAVYAGTLGVFISILSLPLAALATAIATLAIAAFSQAALATAGIDVPLFLGLTLGPAVYLTVQSHRYLFLERRSTKREAEIREGLSVQQQFLPEALIGRTLSHYLIEEKLGAGGMGVVYRGKDQRSGLDVAVKVLSGGLLASERTRRRFRREASALARLRHEHIATLIESDSQDGHDFIAMEFVRGESLAATIRRGRTSGAEAIRIATQISQALAEAHRCGVLHRDLKPANVMITPEGNVKLLDFGLARLGGVGENTATMATSLTESGFVAGTLGYLAPEALQGGPVDEQIDVYGVGVILFEMVTGRPPFPNDHPNELVYMILNQSPPRPGVLNGRVSPDLEVLILDCLSKKPADRPAGAASLLEALEKQSTAVGG